MQLYHFHADTVTSTNDVAAALLAEHDQVMVTANFQTAGRGRNGNVWVGSRGANVYCTFGLNHKNGIPAVNAILFQALGGIAVINMLRATCKKEHNFRLKYPNDVMARIDRKNFSKICGIICEQKFLGSVCASTLIGIGINVGQTAFSIDSRNTPTSLKLLGENLTPAEISTSLATSFMEIISEDRNALFSTWKKELNFEEKRAQVFTRPGDWIIKELLENGSVRLESPDGSSQIIIDNGDSIRYDLGK